MYLKVKELALQYVRLIYLQFRGFLIKTLLGVLALYADKIWNSAFLYYMLLVLKYVHCSVFANLFSVSLGLYLCLFLSSVKAIISFRR